MKGLELESLLADKRNLEQILDNLMEGIIAHDKSRRILFQPGGRDDHRFSKKRTWLAKTVTRCLEGHFAAVAVRSVGKLLPPSLTSAIP